MAALEELLDELEPFARVSRDEVRDRIDEICEGFVASHRRDERSPTDGRLREELEKFAAETTAYRVMIEKLSDEALTKLRGGPPGRDEDPAQTQRLPLPRWWPEEYRTPLHEEPTWLDALAALGELAVQEAMEVPKDRGGGRSQNAHRDREGNPDLWFVQACAGLFAECYPDKLASTDGGAFHRFCEQLRAQALDRVGRTTAVRPRRTGALRRRSTAEGTKPYALLIHVRDVVRWRQLRRRRDDLKGALGAAEQHASAEQLDTRELDEIRRDLATFMDKSPLWDDHELRMARYISTDHESRRGCRCYWCRIAETTFPKP